MPFDVNAFVNGMIGVDDDKRNQLFRRFKLGKLTTDNRKELYTQVRTLYNHTSKTDPSYQHLVFLLGFLRRNAIGCSLDENRGIKLYNKASELGNVFAKNQLEALSSLQTANIDLTTVHYSFGEGSERDYTWIDYKAAIPHLKRAITLGNVQAMVLLAECYEQGHGVGKNYLKAIALYKKAIAQENSRAMVNLAHMYEQGHGVPLIYQTAADLYRKAVDLKNIDAMIGLARIDKLGLAGSHRYVSAADLYDEAIKLGSETAMLERAQMYADQQGIPDVNGHARAALYDKAMARGNQEAVRLRAEMYKNGEGGPVSLIKYRILDCIANSSSNEKKALKHEDEAIFQVIAKYSYTQINETSIRGLAEACQFLNQLQVITPGYSSVQHIKQKILNAVGEKIIPHYPLQYGFHKKLINLDSQSIYGLIVLIENYSFNHYTIDGQAKVKHFLSYESMAKSSDPYAQNTLKKLSQFDERALYWAGVSCLRSNQPAKFFKSSDYEKAIAYFQKAADVSNTDEHTRVLAQEKLAQLDVEKPRKSSMMSCWN